MQFEKPPLVSLNDVLYGEQIDGKIIIGSGNIK